MKLLFSGILFFAVISTCLAGDGDKIPATTLKTLDGKKINAKDFSNEGKPFIINFWATWCPPCIKELPEINQFYNEARGRGWQVLAIAVDNSERMVEYGSRKARENGMGNLEFRLGDIVDPPLDDAAVDVAILSHALHHAEDPARAVCSAHRILRPGGQVLILDLVRHRFEQARERYGDRWLGFAASDLQCWMENAGFESIEVGVVSREDEPPHFETLLASGTKPVPGKPQGLRPGH